MADTSAAKRRLIEIVRAALLLIGGEHQARVGAIDQLLFRYEALHAAPERAHT
jgi:hypothetical protein